MAWLSPPSQTPAVSLWHGMGIESGYGMAATPESGQTPAVSLWHVMGIVSGYGGTAKMRHGVMAWAWHGWVLPMGCGSGSLVIVRVRVCIETGVRVKLIATLH